MSQHRRLAVWALDNDEKIKDVDQCQLIKENSMVFVECMRLRMHMKYVDTEQIVTVYFRSLVGDWLITGGLMYSGWERRSGT